MEPLDEESAQIRDVYAKFGLTMYVLQSLERQLAMALATEYGPGPDKITKTGYDELIDELFAKTFGSLVTRLRQSATLPMDFEGRLREAQQLRNWLVHHYFWDRAGLFVTSTGRVTMLAELEEFSDKLSELDEYFDSIVVRWGTRHGITRETVERNMKQLAEVG
jgi:hypothetical protein